MKSIGVKNNYLVVVLGQSGASKGAQCQQVDRTCAELQQYVATQHRNRLAQLAQLEKQAQRHRIGYKGARSAESEHQGDVVGFARDCTPRYKFGERETKREMKKETKRAIKKSAI